MLKPCGAMVKHQEGKKEMVVNCRNCIYGASVADFPQCMARTLDKLVDHPNVDLITFEEFYERMYDEKQTAMLREVAAVLARLRSEKVWSPSHLGGDACERFLPERSDYVTNLVHNLIRTDPIAAYFNLRDELKKERIKIQELSGEEKEGSKIYLQTLSKILKLLEQTVMIRRALMIVNKLHALPKGRQIYKTLFESEIKPSFIRSKLETGAPAGVDLIDSYKVLDSEVEIYKHPEKIEYMYYVYPPEYSLTPDHYFLLNKTKEIVTSQKVEGVEFEDPDETRRYFERIYEGTITDLAEQNDIDITYEDTQKLARIVARYTVGFGILEILLADERITDVYIDAPIGMYPIYVVHSDYEQCETNILYTTDEATSIISKFRTISGRPFDESHPVLDIDLDTLSSRIAIIGKPLSPDGVAMAFRRHKNTPWTLPQFIDVKMINPLTAGILSFLIDAQSSTLVVGSRGAGKSSMMQALMLEIPQNLRILTQEDTLEIPNAYLKSLGFNVQRMKTRSAINVSKTDSEVAPEEALRTALRLGDSVLIVGEVRSKEARTLYEAMRVGAVGNVVMGTIHGENAYSVWDRIVNDLEVPTTSFKATDIVVVCAPIRFKGQLKRHRRLIAITEVKKHWLSDPDKEHGFEDIITYDATTDEWNLNKLYTDEELYKSTKESELFQKIMKFRGVTFKEIWEEINIRAKTKNYLVEKKREFNIPAILESRYTVPIHNKLQLMNDDLKKELGAPDYKRLWDEWKSWVDERYILPMVQRKKKLDELKAQKAAQAKVQKTAQLRAQKNANSTVAGGKGT